MAVKFGNSIDLDGFQLLNFVVHNAAVAPGSVSGGAMFWDTTNKELKIFDTDGSNWFKLAEGATMSTDRGIVLWDGDTGKRLRDSGITINSISPLTNSSVSIPVSSIIKEYVDDEISKVSVPVYTASGGIAKTEYDFALNFGNLNTAASMNSGDTFVYRNSSTGIHYNITLANLASLIGSGDTFKTWKLTADSGYTWGSSNIVASGSDTINFVAGTGITLATDSVLKALRITASNSMVYPGAGIVISTGSAWGTSITPSTGYLRYTGSAYEWRNETYSLSSHDHSGVYQPLNNNLTSLAGLSYTSVAFVKMTGANTFSLDTNTYALSSHTHTNMVTYTGTPVANQVAYFDNVSTVRGHANLTFNGSLLNVAGNIKLPTVGNSLIFGNDDTFIRESSDNVLSITCNNVAAWVIDSVSLYASITGGGGIYRRTATSTAPTLLPQYENITTGIGGSANTLSMICSGVEYGRFNSSGFLVNNISELTASAGILFNHKIRTLASASGGAYFNLPHGVAPSSPVNGDLWTTTTGLFARINGSTVGPFIASNQNITLSGDVTGSGTTSITTTIANSAVTYAKIQNVSNTSRFLGRISTGAGVIEELTGTQATTLLDTFTSTLKGLVPSSGGGTTNFLRADGTWAAIPSGVTVTNQADNRIVTATAVTNVLNAESNFTFDGTTLSLTGSATITGDLSISNGSKLNVGTGNNYFIGSGTNHINLYLDSVNSFSFIKGGYLKLMSLTDFQVGVDITTGYMSSRRTDYTITSSDGETSGSPNGYNLFLKSGNAFGGSNGNSGNLCLYIGTPSGSGVRGNIYLGTGSAGTLPARNSETNVVYYDISTGKLSYGTVSTGVTPQDDILDWSTDRYTPYTTQSAGKFDNSTSAPSSALHRLNYDGMFYCSHLTSSYSIQTNDGGAYTRIHGVSGVGILSTWNSTLRFSTHGTNNLLEINDTNTNHLLYLNRVAYNGTGNVTYDVINILDNPSTSGTVSGSLFKATVGSSVRVNFNPRVSDSGSAIAYMFDTHNSLSASGAKLLSIRNNNAESLFVDKDGYIGKPSGSLQHLMISAGNASGVSGTDAGDLILKAGDAISGDDGSNHGAIYLVPGNPYEVSGKSGIIYLGRNSYAIRNILIDIASSESSCGLSICQKGSDYLTLGNDSGTTFIRGYTVYFSSQYIICGRGNDATIYGSHGASSHGKNITITGGSGSTGYNGGNVYLYGGSAGASGVRGDVYFGSGSAGYLPAKSSETNVVYYDTNTGKLSYGTVSTGVTPQSDILNWSTDRYTPYTEANRAAGRFYIYSSAAPTNTTQLAYDGYFRATQLYEGGVRVQTVFGSQSANFVYAAPSGSAGTPSFRALVKADLPSVTVYTDASQVFTSAQTFRAANAIRSEVASTQDAVVIAGRAGGTSSFAVTITPTTLSASRTVTLPDANTNLPICSQFITFSGLSTARTYTLPDANVTLVGLSVSSQVFTAAVTFRAANAIRVEAASTQDAVVLAGRAGGTSSFASTITPTTLSASRTVTLPDANTNLPIISQFITISGPSATRTYTFPDANTTICGISDTQTLTNKTIAASNNTITGLTNSNLSGSAGITYANLQNVSATSRFLGRISTGAGVIEELTGAQATTLLDMFTSTLKGLVPASGGGTTNFLRADGTWAAVPVGVTVANQADNRIITATATTNALNAEANLTFDGSVLSIEGAPLFRMFHHGVRILDHYIHPSGLYTIKDNNDKIIFSSASDGKVGINRSNPAYNFDVNGSARVEGTLLVSDRATFPVGIFATTSIGGSSFFGDDTDTTENHKVGLRLHPTTPGFYFDIKTYPNCTINFRCGHGTEPGDARTWLQVFAGSGVALFPSEVRTPKLCGDGLELPHVVRKTASTTVRNSHDAQTGTSATTYTKVKTITLPNGLLGQVKIYFDLRSEIGTYTAFGRIYKNGSAIGTERSTISSTFVTYSEDITINCNPGDTIELYCKITNPADSAEVRNFRLAYNDSATVAVASSNS